MGGGLRFLRWGFPRALASVGLASRRLRELRLPLSLWSFLRPVLGEDPVLTPLLTILLLFLPSLLCPWSCSRGHRGGSLLLELYVTSPLREEPFASFSMTDVETYDSRVSGAVFGARGDIFTSCPPLKVLI